MNKKMDDTAKRIAESRTQMVDAQKNIASITGLQGVLFANLTRDTKSMLKFFVNDTSAKEDKPRLLKERMVCALCTIFNLEG